MIKIKFPFRIYLICLISLLVLSLNVPPSLAQTRNLGKATSLKDLSARAPLKDASKVDLQSSVNALLQAPNAPKESDEAILMRQQLISKLTGHPKLNEARASVCVASYRIRLNKAEYFPKLMVSLSAGDKFIDKTTRADEFGGSNSPEYDGTGLNATLQLRQQIYDWGNTSANVNLAKLERSRALLERLSVLDEQTAAILRPALEYYAQSKVLVAYQNTVRDLEQTINSIEARFEAGAGTLVQLRQAQVLRLENEAAIDSATRRREQAIEVLGKQFEMTSEGAAQLVRIFLENRPLVPPVILAEVSLRGRLINLELQGINFEGKKLSAQRFPKIEGVLVGRAWDVDQPDQCGESVASAHPDAVNRGGTFSADYRLGQNCRTHEVTGNLEFSMPLYDGGANRAQRGEVKSRRKSLESKRLAFIRDHEAESNYLQHQLQEYVTRYKLQNTRHRRMSSQLDSLLAVQGKTQSTPLEVGRLQGTLTGLSAELILLNSQIENVRLEGLLRANALARTLAIELENPGC